MQPKVAESCRMQLSATLGGFVQLCAPVGALSRRLSAPRGAESCTKPPKATEHCILQLSAPLGCIERLGQ
eukprot:11912191-Alexandrium_andersonii.AAC.1